MSDASLLGGHLLLVTVCLCALCILSHVLSGLSGQGLRSSREGHCRGRKADPNLTSLVGPSGLAPWTPGLNPSKVLRAPPAWPPCSRQPASPLMSEAAESCLGQAGPLTEGTDQAVPPGARWVPSGHVHLWHCPALPSQEVLPPTPSPCLCTAQAQTTRLCSS